MSRTVELSAETHQGHPQHTPSQEDVMGGKPNPGTKKDRRLKENRPSKSRSKKGKK